MGKLLVHCLLVGDLRHEAWYGDLQINCIYSVSMVTLIMEELADENSYCG